MRCSGARIRSSEASAARTDFDAAISRLEKVETARRSTESALREAESRLESVADERDVLAGELQAARQHADVPGKKAAPAPTVEAPAKKTEHKADKKHAAATAHAVAMPESTSDGVWATVRLSPRFRFRKPVEVHINGESGLLYDLSVAGCQFVSPAAVKPNQVVKLLLPFEPKPIPCSGKIMWARLEPPSTGRLFGYRAGVGFTKPDQSAIEAFLSKHPSTPA
jgi:hypothetical protein